MTGVVAVLWREYLFFKSRYKSITLSATIAPLLYLTTFGLGLGKNVHIQGIDYLSFLVPGIVAISTMNTSYSAVALPTSIAKLHDKTLEEYMIAPITNLTFTLGKISAGAIRGVYAAFIILVVAHFFHVQIMYSPLFFLLLLLNCFVFSSLGFLVALLIKTHTDMTRFNNFVMTPMIFVCGTFFSLNNVPNYLRYVIDVLPLTPASQGLRAVALGWSIPIWAPLVQFLYLCVFVGLGWYVYNSIE